MAGRLRAELGFRPLRSVGTSLADLAGQASLRARLLEFERVATPSLDRKAQGAYLASGLAYRLGAALALSDLTGRNCSHLRSEEIQVSARLEQGSRGKGDDEIVHYEVAGPTLPAGQAASDELGFSVETLFCGFVEALAADVRLGRGALWRLVSDGIAVGYLRVGRELGRAEEAMGRAKAVLLRSGSPLRNRQMHFLKVVVPAEQSPTGAALADWFRIRGGCCRFYTAEGGDYCGTCVLRNDHRGWLRAYLVNRARANAESSS